MASPQEQQAPIIIIKKKGGHGGHHGGAWKVAYADFVTAMMALFIVLWLLSSSEKVKQAVGGYFRDPEGYGKQVGSGQAGSGEDLTLRKDNMEQLKEQLDQALRQSPSFEAMKDQVQVTVTGEGVRIELLESDKGMFFEAGRPQPTASGRDLLIRLAEQVGKLPNPIALEGHTDAHAFSSGPDGYGNWELSTDRANVARRLLQANGVAAGRVKQVRGFADQRLRKADDPMHASNRRVSIIIQYPQSAPGERSKADPAGEAHKVAGEAHKDASAPEHKADGHETPKAAEHH